MNQPSHEELEHQRELLEEFRDIVEALPKTLNRPLAERIVIRNRMDEIRTEMKEFLRKHPK